MADIPPVHTVKCVEIRHVTDVKENAIGVVLHCNPHTDPPDCVYGLPEKVVRELYDCLSEVIASDFKSRG